VRPSGSLTASRREIGLLIPSPAWPEAAERGPEEAIQRVQYGARPFTLQHGDLLAKGEDLQRRIAATAEEDSKHREQ